MQNEELQLFLASAVSPEKAEQIIQCAEQLSAVGFLAHELAITNAIDYLPYSDYSTTLATIESILLTATYDLIRSHGIKVITTDLSLLSKTIQVLFSVDGYGDPDTLIDICQGDLTSEEKFAEILGLFVQGDPENIIVELEYVNPALIDRLLAVLTERSENGIDEQDAEDVVAIDLQPIRDRVKAYLYKTSDTFLSKLIADGLNIGRSIDSYVEPLRDVLVDLPPARLGQELLGLVLASDVPNDKLAETIDATMLELVSGDARDIASAQSAIATLRGVTHG